MLEALDDKAPETLAARAASSHLLSPYTMIQVKKADKGYSFSTEPFAVFFEAVLQPVLAAFDATADALAAVPGLTEAQQAEIIFLRQYRTALAETDVAQLESQWNLVDRKWMDCKGDIQVRLATPHPDTLRTRHSIAPPQALTQPNRPITTTQDDGPSRQAPSDKLLFSLAASTRRCYCVRALSRCLARRCSLSLSLSLSLPGLQKHNFLIASK